MTDPQDPATLALEVAWLIEVPGPLYWTGRIRFDAWGPHTEAVRFARWRDADQLRRTMGFETAECIEHAWVPHCTAPLPHRRRPARRGEAVTPEQRAAKIQREVEGRGIWKNAAETELLIARAIRAERNAALEEAAEMCHPEDWNYEGRATVADVRCALENTQAEIRSLKTRAPRARRKS